ncbi:MAG: glucose-6-phosphate isomerase family protein [Candidatus Methanomethylicaceae archaeon]|jgi:glucose-6-phosphate isomerase
MLELLFPFGTLALDEGMSLSLNGKTLGSLPRVLKDLSPVLYDWSVIGSLSGDTVLYRMFRNAILEKDEGIFRRWRLRFDITVISAIALGQEFNKTLGHYHPEATSSLTYPEVYEVLHGKATFLLQRKEEGRITDFVVVEAKAGDALLIPPNYGHVTANTGRTPLILANLVSNEFSSIYSEFVEMKGAAYYLLRDKRLVPNETYAQLLKPRYAGCNFTISKDLYTDFLSCPSCFSYLIDPTKIGNLGQI